MNHDNIRFLLDNDRPDEALAAADAIIRDNPADAKALFFRGKALWRLGRRAEATTAYAAAAELDGPGSPAETALRFAADIDNFFNPDLLNP